MRTASTLRLLVLLTLVSACGSGRAYLSHRDVATAERFALRQSSGGGDVQEVAARFYSAEVDPEQASTAITELLERHPHDATAHEMAALVAELRGEHDTAWAHWLRAASDLRTPFTSIYLDRALAYNLTASQTSASITLLEVMWREHPRPDVRVDAARRLVGLYELRERYADADRVTPELGFIEPWKIIGAFDNDQGRGLLAEHPPESSIDFDAEVRGRLMPVRWRDARPAMDRTGLVVLPDLVSPNRWSVAYLLTQVHSDEPRDVQLRITTPDSMRLWVNGALVAEQERIGGWATDNLVVPIRLEAGWNRVLVKSAHRDRGSWVFGARITDADGEPVDGLRYDVARLHDAPAPQRTERVTITSVLAAEIAEVEPPLRRAVLTHLDATRRGLEGEALNAARALLDVAPEHPVVVREAALTHWTSDELGRAMDLLNQGVRHFPRLAGFLHQRGAFYHQRHRYDRAIEDLRRAIDLAPTARFAHMELASTFESRAFREQQCEVLEGAVERWPESGWALRALGDCQQTRGYLDEAEESYRRADALDPGHGWNLGRLAALRRWRGDHAEAVRHAERLRARAPWNVDNLLTLADYLRYAGRREEARAVYREATERDPVNPTPHQTLGSMAYEDRDLAVALSAWTAALARDPENGGLADRVDFLRQGGEDDPDRLMMPTEEQIEQALAMQVQPHPGAHTVLLLDDEVTTVRQDGSSTRRVTQVHLAVTTDGRDALIATQVPGNARILQAYSLSPEGEHQEASSIRGGMIRFRGLEAGSRVLVQYVYNAAPPPFLPNHFVSTWLFQGLHSQVVQARWVLQLPAGRELAMNVQGPVEHAVRREDDHDVHVFTSRDVAPLVAEPSMPNAGDLLATVTLSTLTDWREYVEWERALLSEVFESNAQLRALATRLTRGASTPRERFDRIFHFVAQEIRYQQDYETTIAGVRPHSCPVVLERGYGDCKDKAVLMILLGREVGLDIRFAILRTSNAGRVLRNVPNQQFNHAIVYVPTQEGIERGFFMDPTTDGLDMGNLREDDQGATALVLNPTDGAWEFLDIPYQDASRQSFGCTVEVSVATSEQAQARARCQARGSSGSSIRRTLRNAERGRQLYQGIANMLFAGARVNEASAQHADDIWHPVELSMDLDVSAAIQPQGEHHRMPTPFAFPLAAQTRLERRSTPLRLGAPEAGRWEIAYEVPNRARIVRTPDDFEVRHACFSVSRRTTTRGRRATVSIEYQRTCTEVSPEDYVELRRNAQRAANQLQGEIVFDL